MIASIDGLYVHVPFCARRCNYCGFDTQAIDLDNPLIDSYVDALIKQIRRFMRAGLLGACSSVYLGGGTPSYIGQKRLSSFAYLISMSIDGIDDAEFTVEANPDSFDERLFKDLRALGVNRYSIGVQSLDDEVLSILGRVHDAATARRVMDLLDEHEQNYSVDLMCGIPAQPRETFERSLREIAGHAMSHVSVYPLAIEPDTPFDRACQEGVMPKPDEDLACQEMIDAKDILEAAGFKRYEVASYERHGKQARHNTLYWTGKQYLGIGAGAASAVYAPTFERMCQEGLVQIDSISPAADGEDAYLYRLVCPPSSTRFVKEDVMAVDVECLSRRESICERVMLEMRMARGVAVDDIEAYDAAASELLTVMESLVIDGLVYCKEGRYRPTERGWLMGNVMYGRIWDVAASR